MIGRANNTISKLQINMKLSYILVLKVAKIYECIRLLSQNIQLHIISYTLLLTLMVNLFSGMEAIAIILVEMLLTWMAMPNFDGGSSSSPDRPAVITDDTAANCCASFRDR